MSLIIEPGDRDGDAAAAAGAAGDEGRPAGVEPVGPGEAVMLPEATRAPLPLTGGSEKARALAEAVRGVADAAGVAPSPIVAMEARKVYVGTEKSGPPPDDLAMSVANILGNKSGREGLFFRNGEVVTWDVEDGGFKKMTASAFVTWLPDVANVFPVRRFDTDSGEAIKGGMSPKQAEIVLNSRILRSRLPVVRGIHWERMPVLDEALDERGLPKLRVLPLGYDEATGIYTAGGVGYALDMDFDEAITYLYGLFRFFAWRQESRDLAIHLAAVVSLFARGLYDGRAPAFAYNANIQSSGKTTLASWCTWLVYGTTKTTPLLEEGEAKLQTLLDSVALAGQRSLLFDNINWGNKPVTSVLLDGFITNGEWDMRKLNGNDMKSPILEVVVLMTGNGMKVSDDLARRTLMADLWNPLAAHERVMDPATIFLDGTFFKDVKQRQKGLAAVWALVRQWDADGRPGWEGRLLDSFESWSRVVPAIVLHAGKVGGKRVWDCLAVNENAEVGDKDAREFRQLAEFALAEFGPDAHGAMRETFEITVQQFAGVARRNAVATFGLYPEADVDSVVATEGQKDGKGWKYTPPPVPEDLDELQDEGDLEKDRRRSASEWLSAKTRSSFGNALKARVNERYFRGPDNQMYDFRHKPAGSHAPARYAVARVKGR